MRLLCGCAWSRQVRNVLNAPNERGFVPWGLFERLLLGLKRPAS